MRHPSSLKPRILSIAFALTALALLGSCAGAPPRGEWSGPRLDGATLPDAAPPPGLPSDEKPSLAAEAEGGIVFEREAAPAAPGLPETKASGLPSPASAGAARAQPSQSGLKAGFSDDNEQFNSYLKFLEDYKETPHYELYVGERILLKVLDSAGRPVANADVRVGGAQGSLARGRTYSDGIFALYPLEYQNAAGAEAYDLEIASPAGKEGLRVERRGPRLLTVRLGSERRNPAPLPVDIVFVLDTTGSMGEEIERLRDTIEIINANLASIRPKPRLRFGLVLYRDRGDDEEYLTKVQPLTENLGRFQDFLAEVSASGGGDTPEDLQAALSEAVRGMRWNEGGLRLVFTITDAPAQLGYGQDYTYAEAAREAAEKGIKLYGIGTGGLSLEGEYLLRQIAQFSRARYIFLTYGERGESEGGSEGSVSHHSGANFSTDKLEAVVIRFVKEEVARFSDSPLEDEESYYEAKRIEAESREETLGKLFAEALANLSDYASQRIEPGTRLALMPLRAEPPARAEALAAQAEYFGEQLLLATIKQKTYTLVERKELQAILAELELQLSGLADEEAVAKVGKLLGAELLLTGSLSEREGRYELFLKLLRVETAELLSAAKARIDAKLGL